MKKLLSLLLVAIMALGLCTAAFAEEAETGNYKIAILSGTTTQGEEEFRAAERELAKDPDHIITDTYPDSFMAEQETTISKLVAFASDPEVKAIVMCQAVPGAKPAFDKIREMGRDDILLIAGAPQEDPEVIASAADVIMYADEIGQGDSIMEKCAEWGVDVFIHYSFPRHLAMELIAARLDLLQTNAEALGIEFVMVAAPDPTAEAGPTASQQFILEDVPAQMEKYADKKVAFFTTNCGMQEPLQTAILTQPNAYYPQPCCPSPYHGFPAVLALEFGDDVTDEQALQQVAAALNEYDAVDRYSTWPAPVNMSIIEVGVQYARDYINGVITEKNDADHLKKVYDEVLGGAVMSNYVNAEGTEFDNYYIIMLETVNFADYLEQ